jgi:hypothetical protein
MGSVETLLLIGIFFVADLARLAEAFSAPR